MGGRVKGQTGVELGRKIANQNAFLKVLETGVTVSEAAQAVGVGLRTVMHWVKKEPEFKERYEEAYEVGTSVYEAEARRRALHGVLEPVFQGGRRIGTRRVFSDRLLELKLRSRAPDRYRDRSSNEISGPDGKPVEGNISITLVKSKRSKEE